MFVLYSPFIEWPFLAQERRKRWLTALLVHSWLGESLSLIRPLTLDDSFRAEPNSFPIAVYSLGTWPWPYSFSYNFLFFFFLFLVWYDNDNSSQANRTIPPPCLVHSQKYENMNNSSPPLYLAAKKKKIPLPGSSERRKENRQLPLCLNT